MKQIIKNIKLLALALMVVAFVSCDEDDAILPEIVAGFTYTVNHDTGVVTFLNTSENANNYQWNFGDESTSTEINPVKTFETGEYEVVLTVTNIAGATSTFTDTVTINIPVPVKLPIDFDTANVTYDTISTFNGASFAVANNPDTSGSNTSAMAGALTNSGAEWEGFYYDLSTAIDLTTDKTIMLDVYADTAVTVLLKLEEGTADPVEVNVNHSGSGWQPLIFTFDSSASYKRLTLFVDGPNTTAGTFYIDNIKQVATVDTTIPVITLTGDATMTVAQGSTFTDPGAMATDTTDGDISSNIVVGGDTVNTAVIGEYTITYNVSDAQGNAAAEVTRTVNVVDPNKPTTAAPTPPTREAADVISLFSDAYTDVAGTEFNPSWGQATVSTQEEIAGNNTLKYAGLDYQGIQIGSAQDVSGMTHLHIDYWTNNSTALNAYIISSGPVETAKALTVPTSGWGSIDIPLTDFSPVNLADVIQMKFDGNGDIYLDNIYFYNDGSVTPDTEAPTITLTGDATMTVAQGATYTDPGATASDNVDGDISSNIVVAGDTVDTATAGTYTVTYNVSDAAGNAATEVTRTVNVVDPNVPSTAAPTPPTREAANVVSIFSNAYTNVTLNELPASWSQATFEATQIGNDDVWKLSNLDFLGIVTNYDTGIDVSSMQKLHIDYWVPSGVTNELLVKIVNTIDSGEDIESLGTTVAGSWQSIDIDMSGFDGGNLSNKQKITQILIDSDGVPSGDVFIDNIYFYNDGSGGGSSNTNVVSIFSDDYTDIAVNEWGPNWGEFSSRIVDGTLNGSPAKVINIEANQTFAGINFSGAKFDASSFTTFHMQYKVDNLLPGQVVNIKLSNHDGNGGETSAIQYTSVPSNTDVVTLAIPLSDFTAASDPANLARNAIAQIVISAARADNSQPVNITLDNIYFSE